jgi:hypothetical protein
MLQYSTTPTLTWAQRANAENRVNTWSGAGHVPSYGLESVSHLKEAGVLAENLAPAALTAEDLDPHNTRLFVKSLSPELHDYAFLYRLFRCFGKLRMLALNTKRHNAIVEYESKDAALTAKRDCRCVSALSGRTYTIKMFWGKHINREPPVKNAVPNFSQQLERCRQVHLATLRELNAPIPVAYGLAMQSMFKFNTLADAPERMLHEDLSVGAVEMPPGLYPVAGGGVIPWAKMFSVCDVDEENLGNYPLASDPWFSCEPRVNRPKIAVSTPALQLKRVLSPNPYAQSGLSGLLTFAQLASRSTREPFSNFEAWDDAQNDEHTADLERPFSHMYTWEATVQPATHVTHKPNIAPPGSPSSSHVPRKPASASNSTVSIPDLIYTDADDINIPFEAPKPVARRLVSSGKEDSLDLSF